MKSLWWWPFVNWKYCPSCIRPLPVFRFPAVALLPVPLGDVPAGDSSVSLLFSVYYSPAVPSLCGLSVVFFIFARFSSSDAADISGSISTIESLIVSLCGWSLLYFVDISYSAS